MRALLIAITPSVAGFFTLVFDQIEREEKVRLDQAWTNKCSP